MMGIKAPYPPPPTPLGVPMSRGAFAIRREVGKAFRSFLWAAFDGQDFRLDEVQATSRD